MAAALRRLFISVVVLALAACSYRAAPPEKRRSAPRYEPPAKGSTRIQRPSYYTVKRGDTLYAIAWRYGLDHRDLARWNQVRAPFVIQPEQALRLYPPRVVVATAAPAPATGGVRVIPQGEPATPAASSRPVNSTPPAVTTTRMPVESRPTVLKPAPTPTSKPPSKPGPKPAATGAVRWGWPVTGSVVSEFSNSSPSLQGLDIRAPVGSAVTAAAAGEVVYSGSGLAGYGELVIIKHSDRYLSAYAHNRKRFVNEGQRVTGGQKIAEIGSNGAEKPRLHFQIRENGKPVNPRKYLPKR